MGINTYRVFTTVPGLDGHLGQSGFVSKVFLTEEVLPWAIG